MTEQDTETTFDPFTGPLPDFKSMKAGEFLDWLGIDAVRWTRAFIEILNRTPDETTDEDLAGTMVGWFANALEAGRGQGRRELGAAISLVRTQEALGINLTGDLDEIERRLAESGGLTHLPVHTRKPEKYILLDTENKMAWRWNIGRDGWYREEWPIPDGTGGPSLEETEPALVEGLRAMFDDYGPEGVRRTVAQMIEEMKDGVGDRTQDAGGDDRGADAAVWE
jgi:hypothetical protein